MIKVLYDIIYIVPISLLLIIIGGTYVCMPENNVIGCIFGSAFSIWIIMTRHAKEKKRWCSIGIVFVFFVGFLLVIGATNRRLLINEYGWLVWVVWFSIFAIAIGLFMEKWKVFRRAVALCLLAGAIAMMINQWEISRVAVSLLCFTILVCLTEEVQEKWKKSGYSDIKSHVTMTSPILIMLCICILVFPVSSKPYDWKIVRTVYDRMVVYLNQISGVLTHPSEEYGVVGFSDEMGFLGTINRNEQKVLSISIDKNNVSNFYLIGNMSGEFAGNGWVFDATNEKHARMMDTLETTCAIKKYDNEHQLDYIKKTTIRYENLFHNTHYMFAPSKMRVEATITGNPNYYENSNRILTDERMKYGDTYVVSCYILNYDNPQLFCLLNSAEKIEEEEWYLNAKYEEALNKQEFSYEEYLAYQKSIYDNYCDTDGVSEEVALILDEIRGNSDNEYEKMKNLENYLKTLEYTTNPGVMPPSVVDGKTFLDYFLLDAKKGYCAHYATAFVLMARELGVPARYVQGYYVHRNNTNEVILTQSQAHAWPEVYFEHVGWIAFEPTPGYFGQNGWDIQDDSGDGIVYDESWFHKGGSDEEKQAEFQNEKQEDKASTKAIFMNAKMLVIPIVGVACFLVLFMVISRIVTNEKYKRLGFDEKLRYLTEENLRLLRLLGYPMETGETLSEYKGRISGLMSGQNLDFIAYYEELVYSDMQVSKSQILEAEQTYQALRELLKKSKWRYRIMTVFIR